MPAVPMPARCSAHYPKCIGLDLVEISPPLDIDDTGAGWG
jgi:hypothetical protein